MAKEDGEEATPLTVGWCDTVRPTWEEFRDEWRFLASPAVQNAGKRCGIVRVSEAMSWATIDWLIGHAGIWDISSRNTTGMILVPPRTAGVNLSVHIAHSPCGCWHGFYCWRSVEFWRLKLFFSINDRDILAVVYLVFQAGVFLNSKFTGCYGLDIFYNKPSDRGEIDFKNASDLTSGFTIDWLICLAELEQQRVTYGNMPSWIDVFRGFFA